MLTRIDLREQDPSARELVEALPRARLDVAAAMAAVVPVIEDVRVRGAAAVRDASERFDGVRPEHLRVPATAIEAALTDLDPAVREGLDLCIAHNRAGHAAQLPAEAVTEVVPGGRIVQRWIPVRRVGLYVPGGLAVYPSSVVMNAVAAQVAGVERIALASPPQAAFDGLPHPPIRAACARLGVTEVYAAGGAQAIALLAHGAAADDDVDRADLAAAELPPRAGGSTSGMLCEPVDVVTGPGTVYVAAAKRAVRGAVGIDAEAGPTEIAVLADASADPEYVAADLLSQAEHDPNAGSVLITDSPAFADAVDAALARRLAATRHSERAGAALSGRQSGTVLVRDLEQAVAVADAYAAEHLEVHTARAPEVARRIRNAGAIFVGPHSPVPLGDYLAGSNHVLPTGGTARFSSGLSVMTYLKPVQLIEYDAAALEALTDPLAALATCEDLPAHAEAVRARRG